MYMPAYVRYMYLIVIIIHPVGIMTIGIIKLEYFLLNLDWAVFESTTIRTAAEGVKISV